MALKKTIRKYGFDFEYHMISRYDYEKRDNKTLFEVSLYKNKETRDADINDFVEVFNFTLPDEVSMEGCYNYLKTLPMYKDAEDC